MDVVFKMVAGNLFLVLFDYGLRFDLLNKTILIVWIFLRDFAWGVRITEFSRVLAHVLLGKTKLFLSIVLEPLLGSTVFALGSGNGCFF
jgi:hypothetical protein